ncbi:MAG: hypothetical protein ACYS9T_06510 [Planctomycetota bacterium]|jgi:hypothetical protein
MKIKISLISVFFRQTLPVTLIGLPVISLFVLFYRGILNWQNPWISLFILIHSILITTSLGRFRSTSFAYIYTRGYSRDQLWTHKMLATALSVLVVWLPAALIVWLPIRSIVQDKVFVSPYFPLMAAREAPALWFWLFGYTVLLPIFHYVWIRRAQPTLGGNGSVLLAIGVVIAATTLMSFRWHPSWFRTLIWIVSAVMVSTALVGGFLLHRKLEVQK